MVSGISEIRAHTGDEEVNFTNSNLNFVSTFAFGQTHRPGTRAFMVRVDKEPNSSYSDNIDSHIGVRVLLVTGSTTVITIEASDLTYVGEDGSHTYYVYGTGTAMADISTNGADIARNDELRSYRATAEWHGSLAAEPVQTALVSSITMPEDGQFLQYYDDSGTGRIRAATISADDITEGIFSLDRIPTIPSNRISGNIGGGGATASEINLGQLAGGNFLMDELSRIEGARRTGYTREQSNTIEVAVGTIGTVEGHVNRIRNHTTNTPLTFTDVFAFTHTFIQANDGISVSAADRDNRPTFLLRIRKPDSYIGVRAQHFEASNARTTIEAHELAYVGDDLNYSYYVYGTDPTDKSTYSIFNVDFGVGHQLRVFRASAEWRGTLNATNVQDALISSLTSPTDGHVLQYHLDGEYLKFALLRYLLAAEVVEVLLSQMIRLLNLQG